MDRIVWDERPGLERAVALIAYEGWGDAGSASSLAVAHLLETYGGERFAVIDGDDFFDYQVQRPFVELDDEGVRSLAWPETELFWVPIPGAERDLVVVTGGEPHTRWKAYTREVLAALDTVGVTRVVTMGAFIGQVAHTLPVPLVGTSNQPGLLDRHDLFSSRYEGPTGIVGVLTQALIDAGIDTTSVWAAVPHYLSNQDYPPAAFALLEKALDILELEADTSELAAETVDFRRQIDQALDDPELRSYVEELETESLRDEEGVDPGERLVEEIERFLRGG